MTKSPYITAMRPPFSVAPMPYEAVPLPQSRVVCSISDGSEGGGGAGVDGRLDRLAVDATRGSGLLTRTALQFSGPLKSKAPRHSLEWWKGFYAGMGEAGFSKYAHNRMNYMRSDLVRWGREINGVWSHHIWVNITPWYRVDDPAYWDQVYKKAEASTEINPTSHTLRRRSRLTNEHLAFISTYVRRHDASQTVLAMPVEDFFNMYRSAESIHTYLMRRAVRVTQSGIESEEIVGAGGADEYADSLFDRID
jgi:hypothetical protein